MDKQQINKREHQSKREGRKRSRSRDKKQHRDKIKQSIRRRQFASISRSSSSSSSSNQKRKRQKYALQKKLKLQSKKEKKYLTSFESGSEKLKRSQSKQRSQSRSRQMKKQKQQQPQKKQTSQRSGNKRQRPKINGNFLSNLIVGHKVTNQKLDEIDIQKTSEKLQKNFNQTRRPVTMSQYLSNQTLRMAPINREQNKKYVCELQKCQKQFTCIEQFQKHIQKHKQQF